MLATLFVFPFLFLGFAKSRLFLPLTEYVFKKEGSDVYTDVRKEVTYIDVVKFSDTSITVAMYTMKIMFGN